MVLRPVLRQSETAIQRAIVNYLRAVLPNGYRVAAIPNGAVRTVGGRMVNGNIPGLVAGIPDLMIFGGGRCWFIEVKNDRGRMSEHQRDFVEWCQADGATPCVLARSIDDVRAALSAWRLPTREAALRDGGAAWLYVI